MALRERFRDLRQPDDRWLRAAEWAAAALPEEHIEQVPDSAAEHVTHPGAARSADTCCAKAVEVGALFWVAEDLIGHGQLFEPGLGCFVARVAIGVVLASKAAVGLLDCGVVGVTRNAEDLVIVVSHVT